TNNAVPSSAIISSANQVEQAARRQHISPAESGRHANASTNRPHGPKSETKGNPQKPCRSPANEQTAPTPDTNALEPPVIPRTDNPLASVLADASGSTTSLEAAMKPFFETSSEDRLTEQMERMRSLTTGSEGDLNAMVNAKEGPPVQAQAQAQTGGGDKGGEISSEGKEDGVKEKSSARPTPARRWSEVPPQAPGQAQLQADTAGPALMKSISTGAFPAQLAGDGLAEDGAKRKSEMPSNPTLYVSEPASAKIGGVNPAEKDATQPGHVGQTGNRSDGGSAQSWSRASNKDGRPASPPASRAKETSLPGGHEPREYERSRQGKHEIPRPVTSAIQETSAAATPSAEDLETARRLFETNDFAMIASMTGGEPVTGWLGSPSREGLRTAYMQLFNWTNMNVVDALRNLCHQLPLKGEGQQVDRVLVAFSIRWFECNPSHILKSAGKFCWATHSCTVRPQGPDNG
ncbi:hypothetical protein KEM55_002867, partial [Ascosphaera atra]